MDDVAHGLGVAAKLRSDLIGTLLSIGAGKQYLTAAQGEGIRRAHSCLQTLALGVTQGTREDRFSHTMEDKLLPIILLGYALGEANFHEKASLVKADVAAATTVHVGYPCHASIRTLGESAPCDSVHRIRSVFSGTTGAAIFRAVSPP